MQLTVLPPDPTDHTRKQRLSLHPSGSFLVASKEQPSSIENVMSQALENTFPKGLFLLPPLRLSPSFPSSVLPHLMTQASFIAGVGWGLTELRSQAEGDFRSPLDTIRPRE